jgi:hypothetical protein
MSPRGRRRRLLEDRSMLSGKKTYAVAALTAVVTFLHAIGVINDELYKTLLGFLGAGAVATVRAAISRFE